MIKTVSLSGLKKVSLLEDPYFRNPTRYVWVTNKSGSVMYASTDENCSAGEDGTAAIRAGESLRIKLTPYSAVYLDGSGNVELITSGVPDAPFTSAGGSGGGGSASDYNPLANKPKINDTTVIGNKKGKDYGLLDAEDSLTEEQMNALLALIQ